jgi:hypothetical protein
LHLVDHPHDTHQISPHHSSCMLPLIQQSPDNRVSDLIVCCWDASDNHAVGTSIPMVDRI